jgi:hypothetical protein
MDLPAQLHYVMQLIATAEQSGGDRLDRMEKLLKGHLLDAQILLEQSQMVLLRSQILLQNAQRGAGPGRN